MTGTREHRFRALFQSAYPSIVIYARRRVPAGEVDDVVAEVFTVAWRRLDDVPATNERAWLYGVARRVIANQRRSGARRLHLVERLAAQPSESSGEAADQDPAILAALARLRPADQEILRLAAWEQLSGAEIATALGCTPNAAALRLSRARARLRAELTEIEPTRTHKGRRTRSAGA